MCIFRCKLYELNLKSTRQQHVITSLVTNELYDFWSKPGELRLPVIVMVYPEAQGQFLEMLGIEEISYKVLNENIENTLKSERIRQIPVQNRKQGQITFQNYNRYPEIESYVQRLADDYPNIVKLEQFQTTYQGRSMWLVKIGSGNRSKPAILIDGGIHAREWISPAVVLYVIQQLVENKDNKHMIENINWYIIPVLNPDGYEYTFSHERFWRLNRAFVKNGSCYGTDLNRNFDFHWNEVGTTPEPCYTTFAGLSPFDQLESTGLRNVVTQYKEQIKLYLTFHSFANMIVYPWSYTNELPNNAKELQHLGEEVADSIKKVRGTTYAVNMSAHLLGYTSGSSDDWVKGVGDVELSYTFELPGGSGGGGFVVPPSEILDICLETFEGIKVFHNYIANIYREMQE
ncbi:Peptidase [Oryctes borbonicus]|uniref:Peptidase n=1 Tax=Oryctes borbonicus TaxID=1629725 RepID=A0A0T6BB23_9SCAR|nr:Peptidase [Oryctes borbonicus]